MDGDINNISALLDQWNGDESLIVTRLLIAMAAGGLIGLERSFNGRAAGFRTHSLVCVASALLMLLTVFQWELLKGMPIDTIRVDPTRMAQGIMTGIGFLGAGVIMKDDQTIRGLTTAASIWITASIGVLIGMGSYVAAFTATIIALGVLSTFRLFERRIPALSYAKLKVSSLRKDILCEDELVEIITKHDMKATSRSYSSHNEGKSICYEMMLQTRIPSNYRKLAEELGSIERVVDFSVAPVSR